jgi:hypothetical protein
VFIYAIDVQGQFHPHLSGAYSFRFGGAEGHAEPITADGFVPGWAYDVQSIGTSLQVDVYINGPAGHGTYLGRYNANLPRSDINTRFGLTGNHGFRIPVPPEYYGDTHWLYFYALDVNGRHNPLLDGKGYEIKLGVYDDPTCGPKSWDCDPL